MAVTQARNANVPVAHMSQISVHVVATRGLEFVCRASLCLPITRKLLNAGFTRAPL
jgi:hypothetical protein